MLMKNKWIIIMVWLTVLVVYGVWKIDNDLQFSSSGLQAAFGDRPIPVTVNNPGRDNTFVVPMGNNTVWIIDRSGQTVSVITRDKSGQFHLDGTNHY